MLKFLAVGVIILGLTVVAIAVAMRSPQPATTRVESYSTQLSPVSTVPEVPTSTPPATTMSTSELTIDPKKTYSAQLKTSAGDLTIEFTSSTPVTTNNFVTLARKGYYDNTIFHRAISGFMIQGGDPTGTGAGGPGYRFNDEPFTGEYTRGTVAMANAGPNTNGSQFFIMHADYPLPKNYVIFGHITAGLETVDKIATAPVTTSATGERSKPVDPVKILSVTISEK